jgi:pyruvate/2-oxoglutarate dehydrogenase complex dihydrolipoamide dehydrogenase (E3) component
MAEEYDLVVIGAGMGGVAAANRAGAGGARVALIEAGTVGGTCVNVGCTPTKALVRSAEAIHIARRGAEFGFRAVVEVDFPAIIERKRKIVATSVAGLERSLERNQQIDLIRGWARFARPGRIAVDDRELASERIIVASGVRPHIPPIPGLEDVGYLTNETVMELQELPKRLIVLGGGPEGLEFGQAFQRFGSVVTIVQRDSHLAPSKDTEISQAIEEILREEGVEILTGTVPTGVERRGDHLVVETSGGKTFEGDALLVSTGRKPHDLGELGIGEAGIDGDPERGIEIDEELRTNVPGVFAIGDVMGRIQHTHFATYTAGIAVANALGDQHGRYSLSHVPGAIFTDPEIASVGLTAEEAQQQGRKVKVGKQEMSGVARAGEMGETKGFVKFVVDVETDELLGMHVLAHHGGELLPQGVIAMANGGTLAPLMDSIYIHPTLSEGVKAAAGKLPEAEIRQPTGDLAAEREAKEHPGTARRSFADDIV